MYARLCVALCGTVTCSSIRLRGSSAASIDHDHDIRHGNLTLLCGGERIILVFGARQPLGASVDV